MYKIFKQSNKNRHAGKGLLKHIFDHNSVSMKIIVSIFLLSAIVQSVHAQEDSIIKAQKLVQLEQQLNDALPGGATLFNKYLDAQWYVVDEDGNGTAKNDFLKTLHAFPADISGNIQVTNPVFSFHGNMAVIHYVADEHEIFYGNMLHTTYGIMDAWYKTDTSWMMLSMQVFEIPALPPPIAVAAKVLQEYTGTYTMQGGNAVTITLKDSILYFKENDHAAVALFPETNNVFIRKTDARGRNMFVKDATG